MEKIYFQILSVSIVLTLCSAEPTVIQRNNISEVILEYIVSNDAASHAVQSDQSRLVSRNVVNKHIAHTSFAIFQTPECELSCSHFSSSDVPLTKLPSLNPIKQRAGPLAWPIATQSSWC